MHEGEKEHMVVGPNAEEPKGSFWDAIRRFFKRILFHISAFIIGAILSTHDCKPPQNSAYGNGIPKRLSKTASPAPDTAGTSHDGFRDAPRATMQIRPR